MSREVICRFKTRYDCTANWELTQSCQDNLAKNLSNQSGIIWNFWSFQWALNSIIFYRRASTERARRAPKTPIVRVRIKKTVKTISVHCAGCKAVSAQITVCKCGKGRTASPLSTFFQIKFRPRKSINHYREKTHNGLKIIFEGGFQLSALFACF